MQKFYHTTQEQGESISDYLIHIEGVLNDMKSKFPTWQTKMQSDLLLWSRFYSGLHSQVWDSMRDIFRNLAYDVMALMKAAWDLEDEHALDQGQWQTTAKAASAGSPGDPTLRSEVSDEPLSEAKSQMRVFMKEVSA